MLIKTFLSFRHHNYSKFTKVKKK